jgi:hypothetical protein
MLRSHPDAEKEDLCCARLARTVAAGPVQFAEMLSDLVTTLTVFAHRAAWSHYRK